MGGRWVAAALVVVGVISSMSLQVEGEDDMKSHIKRSQAAYLKIMKAGRGVGETCPEYMADVKIHYTDLDRLLTIGKKTVEQIEEDYKEKKYMAKLDADELEVMVGKMEKNCAIKDELVCYSADKKCIECSKRNTEYGDTLGDFCKKAKALADMESKEPKDPKKPGDASRGGWMVRPVDGALVAALLALSALSA